MYRTRRFVTATVLASAASVVLAACGGSPAAPRKQSAPAYLTTTSASTTTTVVAATSVPGVTVPNVIGLRTSQARAALRAAGLFTISLTKPCGAGAPASQSVAVSLAVPGKAPTYDVDTVPIVPGATVPPGSRVGITWSACYPGGTAVPAVVGMKFGVAVRALHAAGLTWACYSVGHPAGHTSPSPATTHPPTTNTTKPPNRVLTQAPTSGAVVKARSIVSLTMRACPQ